jgi:peptidoglycan/xylan/chitin deacetylase (PgdA/CDA1 family)
VIASVRGRWRYRLGRGWLHAHRTAQRLRRRAIPGSFRILLLHDVPSDRLEALERLVRHVKEAHGIIDPATAGAWLAGRRLPSAGGRTPLLFSFDDGFQSQAVGAREILDRHGVKAVFFVCPGLVDMAQDRQHETIARFVFEGRVRASELSAETALASWADLEAVRNAGHAIGSHALLHRRLSGLSSAERRREIVGAADALVKRLGGAVEWFAYPFGDLASIDRESYAIIAERHALGCSGIRGLNGPGTHPLGLLREELDLGAPFPYQQLVLEGGLDLRYATRVRRLRTLLPGHAVHAERP